VSIDALAGLAGEAGLSVRRTLHHHGRCFLRPHYTAAHGRPHVLRRWPTVRQPNSVAVDPVTRRVYVAGLRPSALQVLSAAAPLR
jgi:hypothetical protein